MKIEFALRNDNLAAFDLGHIKNIIDQRQEKFGRYADLLQAIGDFGLVAEIGGSDGGHANDRIHRRADIVGHTRNKIGLCPVGVARQHKRVLQGALIAFILTARLIDIAHVQHDFIAVIRF